MRTFIGTYKIYTDYTMNKFFNVYSTHDVKYKFESDKEGKNTICYLTIIANNRLHLRKLKKQSLKVLKGFGKVELIIGIG